MDYEFAQFSRKDFKSFETIPYKPEHYNEMVDIARILSKDIPFIRVDLYEINKKIYFSELTLSPGSGLIPFSPSIYDYKLGSLIKI